MATIARVMYDVVARDGASRTFRRIGDDATFAEGRVARFGRTFAVAGGVVAAAAVAVGVESVRMATTFQAQMTRIQTQAGGSARDVKVLTGAVLGLSSRRAQQSPQMLAQALYHLKSVGMDNVHAMTALRSASDLAAVGGANLEDTTNALAGAWRSGIKGAQSFGKTAATVNAIIGAGNMTMTDFVGSLTSGILPAARTFGVSLRSVGAAMALMTDEGIPAEVAATRLRMTLSLLGAPSAKAQAQLKAIGLSSTSLANAMRSPGGLVAAVGLLKTHLDNSGLSATKAAQLISNAFGGGRSSAAIMTLLNNYSVLERKQNQINNTIGRYGAAVAAQRKTAGAEFERLRAIIDTVGIRIGLALLPPVTSFVSWIVNRAIPAVGRFGSRVGQVFDQVIPIGTIKRDWQDVLQFLGLSKPRPVKLVTGDLLHLPKAAPLFAGDLLHPQPFHFNDANLFHPLPKSAGAGLASSIASVLHGPAVGNALGTALGDAFASVATHAAMITSKLVTALAGLDWTTIGKTVGSQALGFGIGLIAGFGNDLFSVTWWKKHWWDAILTVLTVSAVGKFAGPLERIFAKIPILRSFTPLLRGIEKLTGPMNKAIGKVVEAVGNGLIDGFTKTFPTAAKWLTREGGLLTTRLGVMGIQMFDRSLSAGRGILRGI
jgi:TP901 family phage tail tape measure protein